MILGGQRAAPNPPGPMYQRLLALQQQLLHKPGGLHGNSYAITPDVLPDPENVQVVVYLNGVEDYAGPISGWTPKALGRGFHLQWFGGGIYWDPNDS